MSCLREPGLMDTVHSLLPVQRRNFLYRAFCPHMLDDRVPYTRIDHRSGPGWMADNYVGQACKNCGWIAFERKDTLDDYARRQGLVPLEDLPPELKAALAAMDQGHVPPHPMPRATHYDEDTSAQAREARERGERQRRREDWKGGKS